MLIIRIGKAALVAAVALHASLAVFGNVTDYAINFTFVQHVLSMDTIFPNSTIRYRAITTPALHHAAYAIIMAGELLTGGPVLDRARRGAPARAARAAPCSMPPSHSPWRGCSRAC